MHILETRCLTDTARRVKFDVDASQREEQTRLQPHVTHSPRPEEARCTGSDQPEHESEVDQAVQGRLVKRIGSPEPRKMTIGLYLVLNTRELGRIWLDSQSLWSLAEWVLIAEMAWILKSGNANEDRQRIYEHSETDASGTIEAGLVDDRQESGMENRDPPTASVAESYSVSLSSHLPLFINLAIAMCCL
ncbi:hypothetical protein BLNAU_23075 [Blattamonas nauphoetae]|uniref:Uncharacterized protein n=1 Tax=Blattamonas nauphoetae TaxID=2049346 RepID=A0ABQ9WVF1_9EUKA|nr:hypothetical protein BLNAU_23075 [Blattamonas nauphoetae]